MKLMSKEKFRNANNKLKREFRRLPILSGLHESTYARRLADHANRLPALSEQDQAIVDSMRAEGIFATHLSELNLPLTAEAVQTAKALLANPDTFQQNQNKKGIPAEVLNQQPDLLLWAMDERLLDIVENYIGLPIFYLGVEVRQEFADGEATGVRKWHIDTEDYRMFKVIIYLNDVDECGGPFEYIPKTDTQQAAQQLRYNSGLVSDALMCQVVPTHRWSPCTGPQGTAVFVDPCSIFHRAKPPSSQDRLSITYHFISQFPLEFRSDNTFSDQPFIPQRLSPRQRLCLL